MKYYCYHIVYTLCIATLCGLNILVVYVYLEAVFINTYIYNIITITLSIHYIRNCTNELYDKPERMMAMSHQMRTSFRAWHQNTPPCNNM